MTVKFWSSFSKRQNSTKQPTAGTETASLTCRLKEATSLHEPVIELSTNNFSYEYAYISDFGKYYFVRDVVSSANGLAEYHLIEDTLATYKDDIGSTVAHISFSSSGYDPFTIDPRIVVSTSKDVNISGGGETERVFPSTGGYYILSVFNDAQYSGGYASNGVAVSYAISPFDMDVIREFLSRTSTLTAINSYLFGEPLKAVFSCIWVPYEFTGTTNKVTKISIGSSETGNDLTSTYVLIDNPKRTNTISVPCHLRYTDDFRMSEPYTTGNIYLPGVGVVNLNMSDWINSDNINVQYTIEEITGNMRYFLKDDDGNIIQTHDCCVAAQCPLGQMVLNGSGIVSGIAGAVGGAAALVAGIATGGSGTVIAGGALAMTMGAANTVLADNKRSVMTSGSIGGRMIQTQPFILHTEFSVDTEDPEDVDYIAQRGGAYKGTAMLSLVPGYIHCECASVDCSASALEKEEINNYLNNGFYYE